jgi:SAM-dependent methyltransferase
VTLRSLRRLVPGRNAARRRVDRLKLKRQSIPARLGDFRRTTPINAEWGRGRGKPIDRVYIEMFLSKHGADIRGRALEASDSEYVRRFGTAVERTDILDVSEMNPKATIVADLVLAPQIPDNSFDCVVLTQVLQYVADVPAALATIHRVLASGGVFLATVPCIARSNTNEPGLYGDFWRFTSQSARLLADEIFGIGNVEVTSYGNVLSAAGFLYGLGSDDLSSEELAAHDPAYEVLVALRAVKSP